MNPRPPKQAVRFLRWFCREEHLEEIEGDLTEIFKKQYGTSPRRARWIFAYSVIRYFRPVFLKPLRNKKFNTYGMYKSYFKVGWRNLLRHRGYSIINITGLALGMTVAILNGLWIWDEFSINKYFQNYGRIAQVAEKALNLEDGGHYLGTTMTYPLSIELIENYSQHFQHIARASFQSESILSLEATNHAFMGIYVSEVFPEMFSFNMIQGDLRGLSSPNSIFISRSLANKVFGTTDVLNRTLKLNNKQDVAITGVYEDFPFNAELSGVKMSDIQFCSPWSLYLAQNKWIEERVTDWRNHFLRIYVQIPPDVTFESVTLKIKNALQFDPADIEKRKAEQDELDLYPMDRWHMYPPSHRGNFYEPVSMVRMVGAIGLFVLLLACINFMNLSTARSINRSKEVGIRKTVGSVRSQLIHQFFSESALVVSVSFVFALVLTLLVLPSFNGIAGKDIEIPWTNSYFWISGLSFIIFTSVVAGSYPALYLSSFNPIKVLKGTFKVGRFASLPRKVLVVFQFAISVILIISTIMVYQQIQFARNRPVGYDREGLIMINKKTDDFYGKYDVMRTELLNTGLVSEVSESMGPVTEVHSANNGWDWRGRDPKVDENFATLAISHTHGRTVGWQFMEGRDFDISRAGDSTGIIINETAAKLIRLQHPVGETLTWTWWANQSKIINYTILGVIKDNVMDSPYGNIEPSVFYLKGHNGTTSWINIRIKPQTTHNEAVAKIESVFKKIVPSAPFEYKFADEEYSLKFVREEQIGTLASVFAVLAIFISCLGLLGLASFVAEQRTKEIGIRKVLGASVAGLWRMLSTDFVVLILIACLVASPVAYYFLSEWLRKFAYHTDISAWIFVLTAAGAVLITLLTISFQAIKAAMLNPVKSLRSE